MSERYEGAVFRCGERTARRAFRAISSGLRLRLVRLVRGVYGIYRVTGRADPFDRAGVEDAAREASAQVGEVAVVFYDNSCGVQDGVLYSDGIRSREFGPNDAWWVQCDGSGKPASTRRLRVTDLRPGPEYECIFTAIDATLQAVRAWPRVSAALVKQAFCYDEPEALADSAGTA
jgi:hypothetical protein